MHVLYREFVKVLASLSLNELCGHALSMHVVALASTGCLDQRTVNALEYLPYLVSRFVGKMSGPWNM